MKLNNTLKRLTWFIVGYLLISTGFASYLHMMGVQIHWSELILVSIALLGIGIVLFKDDIFQNEASSNPRGYNMSVLVYGRTEPACKFCKATTDTLDLREVDYEFIDLSFNPELLELFKMHHETIPQVYYNGKHVGGSEVATHVGISKKKNNNPLDWEWTGYEG